MKHPAFFLIHDKHFKFLVMYKKLFFLLIMSLGVYDVYAQISAYVGEPVYLNAPSVPGTMGSAAWYCTDKENYLTVSGNHYGATVRIDYYFTGTATIACQYAYSYYSGGKKQYGHDTVYYYISCTKSKVVLNKSNLSLNLGESVDLTYENSSGFSSLPFGVWTTSDYKVAEIDGGEKAFGSKTVTITAINEGECTIKFDGHTGEEAPTCNITVKAIPPKEITVSPESLTLKEGKKGSFSCKLSPKDAYSKITWSSSDENVAKVSSAGVVTAISAGTAKITAATSNGLSAYGTVHVSPLPQQIYLDSETELALGYSLLMIPKVSPTNASSDYLWESSDSNVVSVDADGTVKGQKVGNATITVTTENDRKASSRISVIQPIDGMDFRNAEVRVMTLRDISNALAKNLK